MKKRLVYLFVILIGLVLFISACEQYVGKKIINNKINEKNINIKSIESKNIQEIKLLVQSEVIKLNQLNIPQSSFDKIELPPERDWQIGAVCSGTINEDTILD